MGNLGGHISDTHPIGGGVLQLLLLGMIVTITLIVIVTIIIIIIVICDVIVEYNS